MTATRILYRLQANASFSRSPSRPVETVLKAHEWLMRDTKRSRTGPLDLSAFYQVHDPISAPR
jgi:hypothetical protein